MFRVMTSESLEEGFRAWIEPIAPNAHFEARSTTHAEAPSFEIDRIAFNGLSKTTANAEVLNDLLELDKGGAVVISQSSNTFSAYFRTTSPNAKAGSGETTILRNVAKFRLVESDQVQRTA